jgi:hypothetical protein
MLTRDAVICVTLQLTWLYPMLHATPMSITPPRKDLGSEAKALELCLGSVVDADRAHSEIVRRFCLDLPAGRSGQQPVQVALQRGSPASEAADPLRNLG